MDITYKKVGDYYYPELELPKKYENKPIAMSQWAY